MKSSYRFSGFFWTVLYVLLALVPIIILLLGPKLPDRPPHLDLSDSLAFVGLAMMTLQFISSARIKPVNKPFGTDLVYYFHRQAGLAAFLLVFSHPVLLFILDTRYLRFLNLLNAPLRNQLGVVALLLLIGVPWMAEYRQKLKIPYWFWKLWHGILASLMMPMAFYHIFTGGNYINLPWKQALWIGYSVTFTLVLLYTRVIYPLRLISKPWRVKEVREERGSVWTITLEPMNHKGFQFMPGQFAWLTAWKTPFSDSEHPFTIASSAENKNHIEMSIKSLGKFTAKICELKIGDKVYVDGPYGHFSIDRFPHSERLVLVPGGIGATPIMSMLRTMADRGDQRPIALFYSNQEWDTLTFREEVEALKSRLNIRLIYTIERPPQNWQGESGFLNKTILEKYLDNQWLTDKTEVFLCGPAPMMKAVEKALVAVGFNEKQIQSERFALG